MIREQHASARPRGGEGERTRKPDGGRAPVAPCHFEGAPPPGAAVRGGGGPPPGAAVRGGGGPAAGPPPAPRAVGYPFS